MKKMSEFLESAILLTTKFNGGKCILSRINNRPKINPCLDAQFERLKI